MAEQAIGGPNERILIRQSAKFQKKYGSTTTNHMKSKSNDLCLKHVVNQTDTLQGIALKYGVTMEQIRRANKIWTNDSLFLRKMLDIPVSLPFGDTLTWDDAKGDNHAPSITSVAENNRSNPSSGQVTFNGPHQMQRRNSAPEALDGLADPTIADILNRIDSSIAQTRSRVEHRERLQEVTSGRVCTLRKTSQQYHHLRFRQSASPNFETDLDDETASVTVQVAGPMTQGRKVKSSLQRLQREQDAMFEL